MVKLQYGFPGELTGVAGPSSGVGVDQIPSPVKIDQTRGLKRGPVDLPKPRIQRLVISLVKNQTPDSIMQCFLASLLKYLLIRAILRPVRVLSVKHQ